MSHLLAETSPDLGPGAGLECPLCGYDLRGTAQPRCPECGYSFDWVELRAGAEHPYLFEHHRRRNIRSFVDTLAAGWRPAEFWATLQPTQPSDNRRLAIYQFLTSLPAWLVPLTIAVTVVLLAVDVGVSPFRELERVFLHRREARQLTLLALQLVLWPWLTLATLMIFQSTIRRARSRPAHLFRCAIYSSDVAVAGGLLLLVVIACVILKDGLNWTDRWHEPVLDTVRFVMIAMPVIVAWRLTCACRRYLRIPHAAGVAIVTQLMLALALANPALREGVFNLYWLYL